MDEYRKSYNTRLPNLKNCNNDDECQELSMDHGVSDIENGSFLASNYGTPPQTTEDIRNDKNKYIWVIRDRSVPIILENSKNLSFLSKGRATHTNLTGCKEAYSGGEAWFRSQKEIYISGASSRYQPRNQTELNDICEAFQRIGYRVESLGWDEEMRSPKRIWRTS